MTAPMGFDSALVERAKEAGRRRAERVWDASDPWYLRQFSWEELGTDESLKYALAEARKLPGAPRNRAGQEALARIVEEATAERYEEIRKQPVGKRVHEYLERTRGPFGAEGGDQEGQPPDLMNAGAAAGAVAGALMLGPVGLVIGGLLGGALGAKTGAETDGVSREMAAEEYVGTPGDPNWESEHNEVAASEAVRRVKELAKPLQNDQAVNAADYLDLAQRLIGGIDVDAIVPTKPIEERAIAAIWSLREYVNAPGGRDPIDFVDVAVRVLHDTKFLRPAGATPTRARKERKAGDSDYACWVVTQRRPREVRTWSHTRKADAIRDVREAVKEHRTEGGVTCHDPRKPFEVQFAWKRGGKIEATEF